MTRGVVVELGCDWRVALVLKTLMSGRVAVVDGGTLIQPAACFLTGPEIFGLGAKRPASSPDWLTIAMQAQELRQLPATGPLDVPLQWVASQHPSMLLGREMETASLAG